MHETLSLWQAASLEATDWFKCLRGVMPINSLVSLLPAIEICINEGWIIKERGWITRDKTMSQEWELKRKELRERSSLLKPGLKTQWHTQCATSEQTRVSSSSASFWNFRASSWIWRCQKLMCGAAERWKLFLHASLTIFRSNSVCCYWLHNKVTLPVLSEASDKKELCALQMLDWSF